MNRLFATFPSESRVTIERVEWDGREVTHVHSRRNIQLNRTGALQIALQTGYHRVSVDHDPFVIISMPDDGLTHDLNELIVRDIRPRPQNTLAGLLEQWVADSTKFIKRGGDSMEGPLLLNASPGDDSPGLQAATKDYVDQHNQPVVHVQSSPTTDVQIHHGRNRTGLNVNFRDINDQHPALIDWLPDGPNHIRVKPKSAAAFIAIIA